MRRLLLIATVLLAACEAEPPAPVVVYVPFEFEDELRSRFAASEFDVSIVAGRSASLTARVIGKQDSPRADVLITSNAIDIWRAADEGALRPIFAESLSAVPAVLKDPDESWAALDYRQVLIGAAPATNVVGIDSLGDLGGTSASGRLCLTSSRLEDNRALIGLLIEEFGVQSTERLVRNWVRNLAAPPFQNEAQLHAALGRGECELAVLSGIPPASAVEIVVSQPVYLLIDGIGISRHAENADAAQRLVAELLADYQSDDLGNSSASNAGIAGWRDREAVLLAERAGYR